MKEKKIGGKETTNTTSNYNPTTIREEKAVSIMCRLVSYRHVIANAPAGTFFSPPLGWFFSCLLYLILVCVCRLMAMLRVNRLSRANLYLLYSYTQILILFSPIVPQKKKQ